MRTLQTLVIPQLVSSLILSEKHNLCGGAHMAVVFDSYLEV